MSESPNETGEKQSKKPGFFQVVASVMAAAIGVQSARNRERDFTHGNPLVYIVAGLVFTVVFVLTLIGIVMLVVS